MDRLTFRSNSGYALIRGTGCSYGNRSFDCQLNEGIEKLGDVFEKLAEYEDLEEQGKLLKLPCAVGDTIYRINKGKEEPVISMKVCEIGAISLKGNGFEMQIKCRDSIDNGETFYLGIDIGKTVFLTKSEAEEALKKMNGRERECIKE